MKTTSLNVHRRDSSKSPGSRFIVGGFQFPRSPAFGATMKRCYLPLAILTGLVLLALARTAFAQVNRKHIETELAPFSKEVQSSAIISPDGRHIAYLKPAGGSQTAVLDGTEQKPYEKISALRFSPDSKQLAYAASSGGKWMVVVNGHEETPWKRIGTPVFSPDSKRLAYIVQQPDDSRAVVLNGKPGKAYDRIFEGLIAFSPDSQHVAYGVLSSDKWHLVLDDQEGPPVDFLGSTTAIQFSPDSTRVAYAARAGNRWNIVLRDIKKQKDENLPTWDDTGELVFSPDSRRTAYAALKDKRWRVVLDGAEQKPYEAIAQGMMRFSPDGKSLAYVAGSGGKWLMVYNGQEGKPYDSVIDMLSSPNSKYLAYMVKTTGGEMVVVNAREQNVFDRVGGGTLVFTRNSQRLGYIARSGRGARAVIGPVVAEKKDGKSAPNKTATPAGARKRRYELVGYLNFSPDGNHYVYAASSESKAFTVVDELEAAQGYDAIWSVRGQKMLFDTYKQFHYMAVKNGKIFLVEEETD